MSAQLDWVLGTPRRKIQAAEGIDAHAVWHVGFILSQHVDQGTHLLAWMSQATIAEATGMSSRHVRTALRCLVDSGLFAAVDPATHKVGWDAAAREPRFLPGKTQAAIKANNLVVYRPRWKVSKTHERIAKTWVPSVHDGRGKTRVSRHRVARVCYTSVLLNTRDPQTLVETTGLSRDAVTRSLTSGALFLSGVPKLVKSMRDSALSSGEVLSTDKETVTTVRDTDVSLPRSPAVGKENRAGENEMPYEVFDDAAGVVPDESTIRTKDLRRQQSLNKRLARSAKAVSRKDKPLDDWTALDSAKEFRDRFDSLYTSYPGETGDVLKLSKILGAWRNKYGHDAHTEIATLERWLRDTQGIKTRRHIPAYKKWLSSFAYLRVEVEADVRRSKRADIPAQAQSLEYAPNSPEARAMAALGEDFFA